MPNRYIGKEADALLDRIIDEYLHKNRVKISRSTAITLLCYGELEPLPVPIEREMLKMSMNQMPLLHQIGWKP